MIPIRIDMDSLVDDLGISPKNAMDLIDYAVKEVTANFAREWEATAARKLGKSRDEYIRSLQVVDDGYAKGSVVLFGWLPNAIEEGHSAFDMKQGLLSGDNAKMNAKGEWYNTVPYRWAVPSSIGESEVFSGKMPEAIHEIVKAKPAVIPMQGGGKASVPLTSSELPAGYDEPEIKTVPKLESTSWKQMYYKHKAPKYQGMRKVVDPVTKQNRYQTFRRVSENSDPLSWIHPGFEPRRLAEDALENMNLESTIGNAVDSYLVQIGYEA